MPSPSSARPVPLPARPAFLHVSVRRATHACLLAGAISLSAIVLAPLPALLSAQEIGVLSGRVLDEESSGPVADVIVRLNDLALATTTAADGSFRFEAVPEGAHVLALEHLAYGTHAREIAINPGEALRIDIRISPRAIELSPLFVEAVSELEQRRTSTGHSMNEIGQEEIGDAARRGLDLSQVLSQHMPGLRVRSGGRAGRASCVEYRSASAQGPCNEVSVYVDGVRSAVPSLLYFSMPLEDIARLELLSPLQASTRYGMAAGGGALLVETKRGPQRRREAAQAELMTGFDWSLEEERYRWERVFLSSFAGNAAGLALGLGLAGRCLEIDTGIGGLRPRCPGAFTMGAGFLALALPSASGSYSAGWAGATNRSRGRFLPAALGGAMTATAGYLLLIEGRGNEAPRAETVGIIILALGPPLVTTLADRVFRVLR